jgi:hypothetical protein
MMMMYLSRALTTSEPMRLLLAARVFFAAPSSFMVDRSHSRSSSTFSVIESITVPTTISLGQARAPGAAASGFAVS